MAWLIEAYLEEGLISKIKEKKEEKEFKAYVNFAKELFKELIEWYNNPGKDLPYGHTGSFDFGYYLIILEMLKVPENKIIDYFIKKCKNKAQTLDQWFKSYYYATDDYWKEIDENSNASNAKKNLIKQYVNDLVIDFTSDDEESSLIDINKKCLIYYCCENIKKDSLYRWMHDRQWGVIFDHIKHKSFELDTLKKAIKEADKELGYYLFSECPKGEQKKPFPVKL